MSSGCLGVNEYCPPAIHCSTYGVFLLFFFMVVPKPTSCNPPAEFPVGSRSLVNAGPQGAKVPGAASQFTLAFPLRVEAGVRPLSRLVVHGVACENPSLGPWPQKLGT